jgi:hypothetical protein
MGQRRLCIIKQVKWIPTLEGSHPKKQTNTHLINQLPINQTQKHMQNPNTSKMSKKSNTPHNKKRKPNKKFNTNTTKLLNN